ncbi:MAG: energy-dependent translational throttle protein EttA [Myxococcota bacterium]|nr:energy-dependent translational throttle protein EttA [Myxococcota bacterium]
MAEFVYQMIGTEKVLPSGRRILEPTWLSFFPDAKIGMLGHNGAGKSTLMRIMAGLDEDYNGQTILRPNASRGYLPQEPQLDESLTVRENIELGLSHWRQLLADYEAVSEGFGDPDADFDKLIERQARLQDEIDAAGAWDIDRTLDIAMDALRVPPGDWKVENLSGGEKRRVALCRLLLEKPDMLLLDEPTNHLDAESVAWLERHLADYPGCVIAITHDRYFMDNVAQWILELDHGKAYPFEGNYSGWLEQKTERMRQEKKSESRQAKRMAEELDWIRKSPKGRQAKSKARVTAYDDLVASSQKDERHSTGATIQIPLTKRLGNEVLSVDKVTKAYGDKLLFEDLSFNLPRGGIVGVIGANGAGKTTLFRMIVGNEQPDSGNLELGETVDLAYVDQSRDALDPNKSVWEEISGGHDIVVIGDKEMNSRAYVSLFNFKGSDQQQKVGTLSGGERNRVHLAKLLQKGGNLILLDEPTNDLDVETLANLEEALLAFPGCVVVISHDRFFLDRIATHMLAFEGDSHVEWFEGNFQEYEKDKKRRLGDVGPTRIKYKKLTR